jgi:lipoprotein-releasing system permease protein
VSSWLPFEWIAAARFLREGRLQTAAILLGIGIGVGVIIFMSAALAGQQANIVRRVLSAQAHIVLIPAQEIARALRGGQPGVAEAAIIQKPLQRVRSIDQWQKILQEVDALPEVDAVSPMAAGAAIAQRGEASRSVTMQGVDAERYFRIVPLPEKIVSGQPRLGAEDIVIGVDLATDLGVRVGDKMRIAVGSGQGATLTVTGLVDLGNKSANQRITYVALHTAQALLGLIGGVSSIDLTVHDIYAAEAIAQRIQALTGVEADSWIRTNAQLYLAINAQVIANTTIRFFVGLAIAFGIAAVLIVSVVQKSKEIGILRAMGGSRGQILRVFLLQGAVLGLLGSFVGSTLGAAAILLWGALVRNPDGTPLFPLDLDPKLFLASALLATVSGLIAAFVPALRGARLDPVVAIRG